MKAYNKVILRLVIVIIILCVCVCDMKKTLFCVILFRLIGVPKQVTDSNSFAVVTEAESVAKKPHLCGEACADGEASSSELNNGGAADEELAEAAISQSDTENNDPSSNSSPEEELFQRKRGRPSRNFLRKKYKKYINRK